MDGDKIILKNEKNEIITLKPNSLRSESAAQLNIQQQRVLFYAIYKAQTDKNSVSFTKKEIEQRFDADFGSFKNLTEVCTTLRMFGIDTIDESSDKIIAMNAFEYISYNQGIFKFKFSQSFLPALNEQKQFLQLAMKSIEKFSSKYSVYLYDFLKANMYKDRNVIENIAIADFKKIFKLDADEYKGRSNNFKKRVWEPAVKEVNEFTDYTVDISSKGRGLNTTFTIIRYENEDLSKKSSKAKKEASDAFECKLGKNLVDDKCSKCMRINKCVFEVDDSAWNKLPVDLWMTPSGYRFFMNNTLWTNPYYDIVERVKNNVAQNDELNYYRTVLEEYVKLHPEDEEVIMAQTQEAYNRQKGILRKDKLMYRNQVAENEMRRQGLIDNNED